MCKALTKKEKENCRAYDKFYIDMQSFIRTRFLNNNKKAIKSQKDIRENLHYLVDKCINNFFKPYV